MSVGGIRVDPAMERAIKEMKRRWDMTLPRHGEQASQFHINLVGGDRTTDISTAGWQPVDLGPSRQYGLESVKDGLSKMPVLALYHLNQDAAVSIVIWTWGMSYNMKNQRHIVVYCVRLEENDTDRAAILLD